MTDDNYGYGICAYCSGVLRHDDNCVRVVGVQPGARGFGMAISLGDLHTERGVD